MNFCLIHLDGCVDLVVEVEARKEADRTYRKMRKQANNEINISIKPIKKEYTK